MLGHKNITFPLRYFIFMIFTDHFFMLLPINNMYICMYVYLCLGGEGGEGERGTRLLWAGSRFCLCNNFFGSSIRVASLMAAKSIHRSQRVFWALPFPFPALLIQNYSVVHIVCCLPRLFIMHFTVSLPPSIMSFFDTPPPPHLPQHPQYSSRLQKFKCLPIQK